MRKKLGLITILLLVFTGFNTVRADMGPKPSLLITIKGVEEEYFFDLLVETNDISNYEDDLIEPYGYYTDVPNALIGYQDNDSYSSYALYDVPSSILLDEDKEDYQTYKMNYIAPNEFKIVLVMKDTDDLIVSRVIKTSRFESEITWDLSDVDLSYSREGYFGELTGDIQGSTGLFNSVGFETGINTLLRVVITVLVEVGILLLFGIRTKKDVRLVARVNTVTNLVLGVMLIYIYITSGALAFIFMTILLEVVVFILELTLYLIYIKGESGLKIITYTFIANVATFFLGITLTTII